MLVAKPFSVTVPKHTFDRQKLMHQSFETLRPPTHRKNWTEAIVHNHSIFLVP